MVMQCPTCGKTCDHTVTKLLSKCTECDGVHFSSEQSKALYHWRKLGDMLKVGR